jgi:hypothetical protein
MSEIKLSVVELKKYLQYGEAKRYAEKFGINIQRAYNLLNGRLNVTDADHLFIMALYDLVLPRKEKRFDKLKQLTK